MSTLQPQSILVAALGGEGGGVLADWIVQAALKAGLPVQGTSVPGVAQRTGATSYYIEFLTERASAGQHPVFALMPVPGRVDTVLASELLEAVRMIERGFVTAARTCLITANHRVLTTAEKMAMGDGRFDDERLKQTVVATSASSLMIDLQGLAAKHKTVISAVMFGALAGAGRLPWQRAVCEAVIQEAGLGVQASLAGFGAAYAQAAAQTPGATGLAQGRGAAAVPTASATNPELEQVLALSEARLTDYQDAAYAKLYRTRMAALQQLGGGAALVEVARHLALWMSYEDVIRVADLKTRRERFDRVRSDAQAGADDILEIREHLKPGLEEIAAILPAPLGTWLRRRARRGSSGLKTGPVGKGITLHTTSIRGFAALRLLAWMQPWRPRSLRYQEEHAAMAQWLQSLAVALPVAPDFALQLAELPRLRKGYGDTFERGRSAYERVFAACVQPWLAASMLPSPAATAVLRDAAASALADPEHQALDRSLGRAVGDNPGTKPLTFHPRVSKPAQTGQAAP